MADISVDITSEEFGDLCDELIAWTRRMKGDGWQEDAILLALAVSGDSARETLIEMQGHTVN